MRRTSMLAALLLATGSVHALQPGDLAFTAFNADEDGFALVALRTLAPFTRIYFSDNEWSGGAPGAGSFNGGENTYAWVSGAAPLPAGSVVRFSAIDQATRAASNGAFSLFASGAPGFSATGDTLFAYSGDAAGTPAAFVAALSSENFAGSSLAGTGLVAGSNAVAISASTDFGEYTGARSGMSDFAAYAALVNNSSRWIMHTTGDFAATAPNMAGFTLAPVPEPETYALLLTGLGLVGMRLFQHRRLRRPLAIAPASAH